MAKIGTETPVPIIMNSLVRAGWGALAGREWQGLRSTLQAVIARAKGKGCVDATIYQISLSTGLSERWTSRCLAMLEMLGVIRWQRGKVIHGKPTTGFVSIVKKVLLDLCQQAWSRNSALWTARREATRARLQAFKEKTLQNACSVHTELSAYLNPTGTTKVRKRVKWGRNFSNKKPSVAAWVPPATRLEPRSVPATPVDGSVRSASVPASVSESRQDSELPLCYTCKKHHELLTGAALLAHFKEYAPEQYELTLKLRQARTGETLSQW